MRPRATSRVLVPYAASVYRHHVRTHLTHVRYSSPVVPSSVGISARHVFAFLRMDIFRPSLLGGLVVRRSGAAIHLRNRPALAGCGTPDTFVVTSSFPGSRDHSKVELIPEWTCRSTASRQIRGNSRARGEISGALAWALELFYYTEKSPSLSFSSRPETSTVAVT